MFYYAHRHFFIFLGKSKGEKVHRNGVAGHSDQCVWNFTTASFQSDCSFEFQVLSEMAVCGVKDSFLAVLSTACFGGVGSQCVKVSNSPVPYTDLGRSSAVQCFQTVPHLFFSWFFVHRVFPFLHPPCPPTLSPRLLFCFQQFSVSGRYVCFCLLLCASSFFITCESSCRKLKSLR